MVFVALPEIGLRLEAEGEAIATEFISDEIEGVHEDVSLCIL